MPATLTRPDASGAEPPGDAAPSGPDLSQIRPAPRREPGFDDEVPGLHLVGPLDRQLPFPSPHRTYRFRPAPSLPRILPDPAPWGRRLLIGVIETAAGHRPLRQLSAMLSPSVAAALGAELERPARTDHPHWTHAASIRSVHASEPSEGVAELNATVQAGARMRAIALRLEEHDGRWRCTRLQLG